MDMYRELYDAFNVLASGLALTMRRYSPSVLSVSSDIPGFPAYHQQIETVALGYTGQDALCYPRLSVLRARLHELPRIGAVGECRGLQQLYLLIVHITHPRAVYGVFTPYRSCVMLSASWRVVAPSP